MKIEENRGVTLITLVISIIVLLILAGITVYTGKESIKKAKLEELRTNMLLIEAKAKEYVEEANFKMGINPNNLTEEQKNDIRSTVYIYTAKLDLASNVTVDDSSIPIKECYVLTKEALKEWGLDKIELKDGEQYLIKFNDIITEDNKTLSVEIYNTKGYDGKYSLTEIEQIEL